MLSHPAEVGGTGGEVQVLSDTFLTQAAASHGPGDEEQCISGTCHHPHSPHQKAASLSTSSWLFHLWTPGLFWGHADPHPFLALGGAEAVPYKVLTGLDITHS